MLFIDEKEDSRSRNWIRGFLKSCEDFQGYADPFVYKKANLAAKVMERRGLWKFKDPESKSLPMDYHLQNVAIKTGMVSLDSKLVDKISKKKFLNSDEELELRIACMDAYRMVSEASGMDPYYLDDVAWETGRSIQTENPTHIWDVKIEKELRYLPHPLVDTWRY